MDQPIPTEAHRKLEALAGKWDGTETLHPSPWAPEGGTTTGHFLLRIALGGFFLISDYHQRRGDQVVFTGHGIYGYDPEGERYTMYWVDSAGTPSPLIHGTWNGDTLCFERESERGHHRYTYQLLTTAGAFRFEIAFSADGDRWNALMEGEYRRSRADG